MHNMPNITRPLKKNSLSLKKSFSLVFRLFGIKSTHLIYTTLTSQNQNCCIPKSQMLTVGILECNSSGFEMSGLWIKDVSFWCWKAKKQPGWTVFVNRKTRGLVIWGIYYLLEKWNIQMETPFYKCLILLPFVLKTN